MHPYTGDAPSPSLAQGPQRVGRDTNMDGSEGLEPTVGEWYGLLTDNQRVTVGPVRPQIAQASTVVVYP